MTEKSDKLTFKFACRDGHAFKLERYDEFDGLIEIFPSTLKSLHELTDEDIPEDAEVRKIITDKENAEKMKRILADFAEERVEKGFNVAIFQNFPEFMEWCAGKFKEKE